GSSNMISLFERFNTTHSNLQLQGIDNEEIPGKLTVCIEGSIETYNSDAFQDVITTIIKNNAELKSIIFDLLNVSYISSTAVGAFIRLIKLTQEKRIDMSLVNVNNKIKSVIQVLGFANYVKIVDVEDTKKFPMIIQCQGCGEKIKIEKAGEYKCPHCKKVFSFDEYGVTM
ncbi:MAG: anti-sigma factor antagonist, partial [Spirochaetales bacterium]|nr:anti-sigma factor antagonist [Spirochaetales bacterium]